ncbi:uncharacterized protein Z519_11809 [Cladophialophora bantiana CBS 173.52]|uniref:L-ornithine N(5)-oxygenase n=1 Tax=Cladophialophora bantiana (strain ATCC 10958 / CBS 173.52 / CDC B-1940 / NIH 8579) TaxID=1442370 RepID=A0A0D2EBM3_CLAB1|nr:uncharacterized protein Z519_11809 [Cladophialophora bantiana CBS 173.52]KIW87486.1 hypothetical protein Z519_11809 [Cladophialophora bantiana CBS 173.52]
MIANLVDEYEILDQYHSQPRKLKIIHVGAGASGLLLAYKAERQLRNYALICYEKNPSIGGTWWENRYPGCACDIPAHTYTYTFRPNPEWSGFYSRSDEIQKYFEKFYDEYKLAKYVRLNTEVLSATWFEDSGEWEVELKKGDETFTDRCNVLINGSGVVNKWKWPSIEGISLYKGILAHSANWDTSIDWQGKKVAVLGTGSSSIQMVPHLARGSHSLTVFARNMTYIAPQVAADEQKIDENSQTPAAVGKHYYIEAEKEKFRTDPEFHLQYRKRLESALTEMFPMFLRGTKLNVQARESMRASMLAKIGPGHDELKQRFIPQWSPGCRRLTPGEGYLETLILDHVRVIHDEIARFTETGLVTAAGEEWDFDIIACATGFDIAYTPHFKITGVDGAVMQDEWKETPNIYLSITAPKFPNYFVVNGPTGNWGQGCALPSHEVQLEYALQCCRKMQEEGIRAMEPRQDPTTQINQHLDAWHKKYSVWAEECRSWYKDNKPDGRVYIWPGSLLHHLKTLRVPRYEHYDLRYEADNVWAFLGNGRTDLEWEHENNGSDGARKVDLAPYIRNEDVPWSLDLPLPWKGEDLS